MIGTILTAWLTTLPCHAALAVVACPVLGAFAAP
jgi:hypothetical protein